MQEDAGPPLIFIVHAAPTTQCMFKRFLLEANYGDTAPVYICCCVARPQVKVCTGLRVCVC